MNISFKGMNLFDWLMLIPTILLLPFLFLAFWVLIYWERRDYED